VRVPRWWYAIAATVTIGCGLASRQWPAIPAWVGDLLWATMVFFIVSAAAPGMPRAGRALLTIAVSFLVEFCQLYRAGWIDRIRDTTPGHLVLGQGFAWLDLVAYVAGVLVAVLVDLGLRTRTRRRRSGRDQPAGDRVRNR
jgi:hypothetical protein